MNWKKIISEVPSTPHGRGISKARSELRSYMQQHDLVWSDRTDLARLVEAETWFQVRVSTYRSGGRGQRSYYGDGVVIPGPIYRKAMSEAKALKLRTVKGIAMTTVKPGVRQTWKWGGRKWVKKDRLYKEGKAWRVGQGVVHALTGQACPILDLRATRWDMYKIRVTLRGETRETFCDKRRALDRGCQREAIEDLAHQQHRERYRETFLNEKQMRRVMLRVCPEGWDVVCTASSYGVGKSLAWMEKETGEAYHIRYRKRDDFGLGYQALDISAARAAFHYRRNQKHDAELNRLLDSGQADGVMVCAKDSYRAGNCEQGTRSFAERKSLDLRRHYTAGQLKQMSNGDARFVRAAILQAMRRHRKECERGYSVLADH